MRKINLFFVILLSACTLSTAWAASETNKEALDRDVTVERAYNPTLQQARKMSPIPEKEEYKSVPPTLQYTTWSKTEEVTPVPAILKPISYEPAAHEQHKKGLFKVGLGFYWQTLGEFYYPLLQGDKYLLDIAVGHHSDWGNIELQDGSKPRAATHLTDVAMNFETQFKKSRLGVHADYLYKGFDYYGFSTATEDPLKNTMSGYSKFDLGVNWFSTDVHEPVEYGLTFGYRYFGRDLDISQHQLELEGEVAGELSTGKLGAELAVDVHMLGMQEHPLHTIGKLTFTPFYELGEKEWGVRIGGNLFAHIGHEVMWPVTGSADITAHVALVPELFYMYAGIQGDFSTNDYYSMIAENPYINPELHMEPTYTPLDMNLDFKVRIMKGLLFNIGANYEILLNQYYYVNHLVTDAGGMVPDPTLYTNTFDVVYAATTHHLDVQAGLYFDYVPGLDVSLIGKYHLWSVAEDNDGLTNNDYAWQKPSWEVLLDANYTFLEKFQVGLSYHFLGGRKALVAGESVDMTDVHDLNLYFSYQALDWLTVFANGKNLINIHADSYYGYRTYGINGMIGATFSF